MTTQRQTAMEALRVLVEDKDVGLIDEILDGVLAAAQNPVAHGGVSDGSVPSDLHDLLRKARNHLHSFLHTARWVLREEEQRENNHPALEGHGPQEQQVPFLNPGGDSLPGRRKLPM